MFMCRKGVGITVTSSSVVDVPTGYIGSGSTCILYGRLTSDLSFRCSRWLGTAGHAPIDGNLCDHVMASEQHPQAKDSFSGPKEDWYGKIKKKRAGYAKMDMQSQTLQQHQHRWYLHNKTYFSRKLISSGYWESNLLIPYSWWDARFLFGVADAVCPIQDVSGIEWCSGWS